MGVYAVDFTSATHGLRQRNGKEEPMNIYDDRYYCYMPGAQVRHALSEVVVLDALMPVLGVEGKPAQLKRMPADQKLDAIEERIAHLRRAKMSLFRDVEPAEIVAACIFREFGNSKGGSLFHAVKQEKQLAKPVALWLRERKKAEPYGEVPMGTKRIDVMGHRKGGFFSSEVIIAVELKNELEQLKRGLDQMATFSEYASEVYLACTPYMAASYLNKHAESPSVTHWDPEALNNKLKKFGFGLLLVAPTAPDPVVEVFPPRSGAPSAKKLKETLSIIENRRKDILL